MNNIDTVNTKEEELIMKLKQLETKLNTQNKILAGLQRPTEDSLRVKLQQLENWMTGGNAPPMAAKDLDTDVEMFEKLSKMAKDRMDMDKRIKDLELKEKVFKETLEQADNMIAQLEAQFRTQLNDKDQELNETSARLKDSETKLKVAEKNSSQTLAMQDRITLLESAVEKLKKTLQARDREKERLEEEYSKLLKDVEQSGEDLDAVKNELEAAKKRLESSKKASKQLEEELRSAEVEREAAYGAHKAEVNSLKNQISQLQRDLMENEVTISELKEEVLTLESAVDELRYTARLEKVEKEELTKNFEAQLEIKEKELEEAKKKIGGGDENVRSIMEELEEGEKNAAKGGHKYPWTLANGNGGLVKTVHCFRAEADHVANAFLPPSEPIKETKVKRPTVSPPPPPVPKTDLSIPKGNQQLWHSSDVTQEPPTRWHPSGADETPVKWSDSGATLAKYELKNMTAAQFRAFIALIEEGEPHVDVMSTKGIPLTSSHSNNNLPMECQEANEAVKEISGKEAKLTVEALSKAYNHSKICGDCNERLGSFVEEMVKKLGVRMPRIKNAEDLCEYGGAPSDLKTKEVGPGSVGWDPKSSPGGYKVQPTTAGLLMAAEELKDKCRLKDSMIEALADELRDLERRGRWSAHKVLRELTLYPNPSPVDFNRQTLARYLNNEPLDDFDDRDDDGKEYFATNPLGLTIVRRVGPDSLLLKWLPIADPKITCYEIHANGLLMQRIMSPGRSKALLHPIDLDKKMIITLNALSYDGEKEESASVVYKK
uniref:Serine/threonine-protein kinase MRCK alpha n=1 Tax=Lygus hesperus TaxID=30085 RepID=A0A0A9W347_LYGHE